VAIGFCSPNVMVDSSGVCQPGTQRAGQRPLSMQEAAAEWPEFFQGIDPAPVAPEVTGRQPSWNADTDPVKIDRPSATPDRLTANPEGVPEETITTTVYAAKTYLNELRGSDPEGYGDLVKQLRKYTGSKLGTLGAVEDAWNTVLKDAKKSGRSAMELLDGGSPGGGSDGSGGGRGYTGPRASITVQAESDIRATANALALEMIGRPLNDNEMERVTRRIRTAEQEQPQVTTGNVARTVTTQGLTAQGREDILRDVIAKRPEFEKYQLDTTVMDAMNAYVQEKRQVIDV